MLVLYNCVFKYGVNLHISAILILSVTPVGLVARNNQTQSDIPIIIGFKEKSVTNLTDLKQRSHRSRPL